MVIRFSKYHGAGNDFIMIDGLTAEISAGGLPVADLCNRHTGIGADGLIVLMPSTTVDFRMVYFNSDGLQATMCGNGGRAAAAFASRLGLNKSLVRFEASDGLHEALITMAGVHRYQIRLSMTDVRGMRSEPEGLLLNTGVPHLVVFSQGVTSLDVTTVGGHLRNLPKFQPEGTNVNFVEIIEEGLLVRTYERGVEDETLSCGTGITASVLAYAMRTGTTRGETNVFCRGGNLSVSFRREGDYFTDVMLFGPAVHVFDGTFEI
ncbi:MAG TPA: diaminopimelate epimerase [Bacteroidales bacterium]|nr:MAG: diaminopimelate epimerase [Bacteroidetes bacterium GWE2_42_24]OFY31644.1 MAG: diaminopimelate epimerase [Bacteroidetes bacterium GWF2_43_11]HAQ64454.1 diaminopimelate epimerase [Bacteroidales bacterium]HBZ67095.1 diaminopimelate epimerase [Bacteroidales bacterium]